MSEKDNINNSLINVANELELLSKDESERDKILAAARDAFVGKRITQASRVEQLRGKLIDDIENDIDNKKVNQSMKVRYLEVLSKINEADLSAFVGSGKSAITINNSNMTANSISSDVSEKMKSIKIISSNGEEMIGNQADAHLLMEAIEAVKSGFISVKEIQDSKKILEEVDEDEIGEKG